MAFAVLQLPFGAISDFNDSAQTKLRARLHSGPSLSDVTARPRAARCMLRIPIVGQRAHPALQRQRQVALLGAEHETGALGELVEGGVRDPARLPGAEQPAIAN